MMDVVHRVVTGQTLSPSQLRWAGLVVLGWITLDVVGFVLDHVLPGACR